MPPKILAPLPIQFWRRSVDRNTAGERMPNLRYYVAQVSPATAGLYRGFPNPPTLCATGSAFTDHAVETRSGLSLLPFGGESRREEASSALLRSAGFLACCVADFPIRQRFAREKKISAFTNHLAETRSVSLSVSTRESERRGLIRANHKSDHAWSVWPSTP